MFNYSSPKRHGDKATQTTRPRYALVTTWRAGHNIQGNEHSIDNTHSYCMCTVHGSEGTGPTSNFLSAHYPAAAHATLRLDNIDNTASYNEIQVHVQQKWTKKLWQSFQTLPPTNTRTQSCKKNSTEIYICVNSLLHAPVWVQAFVCLKTC